MRQEWLIYVVFMQEWGQSCNLSDGKDIDVFRESDEGFCASEDCLKASFIATEFLDCSLKSNHNLEVIFCDLDLLVNTKLLCTLDE